MGVAVNFGAGNRDVINDYLNQNYAGFDFVKLVTEMHEAIDATKASFSSSVAEGGSATLLQNWSPKIRIALSSSGFNVSVIDENTKFVDKYGYEQTLNVNCSRNFTTRNGAPSVYHSYFAIGTGLRGGGFAKNLMKSFYKQYLNCGLKHIGVTANITSEKPVNGANTWGKWGFTMDKGNARGLANSVNNLVGKKFIVERTYINHDKKDIVTRNGADVALDPLYKITKTKGTDGDYRSLVERSYEFKQEDADRIKFLVNEQLQTKDRIRVKELYEKVNKDAVLSALQSDNWGGTVDLGDSEQKADFEDNLFRIYNT